MNNNNNDNISKTTLITLVDQQLIEEKEKMLKAFNYKQSQDDIDKMAKHIHHDIKNLSQLIQAIIDKHHKEYTTTFSSFMDAVRVDLKAKLERMDNITEEKKRINDVKYLRCELDFFRKESIRMHNLSKQLSMKIDDMSLRMKILTDEVNAVTMKWKESETANKQLLNELEKNMRVHKELQDEMNQMKEYVNQMNNSNNSVVAEQHKEEGIMLCNEDNNMKERNMMLLIEKYKEELKRERIKNNKLLNEINQMGLEKNKIESIFIDCVEETRKSILNRRLKDKIGKYSTMKLIKHINHSNVNTQYDSFLPKDKREILENFLFNDEVSKIVREALITKPKRTEDIKTANTTLMSKINLNEYNSASNTGRTTFHPFCLNGINGNSNINMTHSTHVKGQSTQNAFYHTMLQKQQQQVFPRLVNSLSQKSISSTAAITLSKRFGY